ncbi:MAG: class I SAM-dependent methyltransferase [Bdellovibrionaceae bacterium]|nr:class I SAM-dependent methyltransferase [Pseudobdellovibrionaceae bacterium]
MTLNREEIVKANIQLHTKLSTVYNETEPHFYPENQDVVRNILLQLKKETQGNKLLDIGCGTGFILNLSHDIFTEVCGIDATKAMLNRVDTKNGKIKLFEGLAEELPFDNESFDVITGYSFLHHLFEVKDVVKESFRVLKKGGKAYFDLEPNKDFWLEIKSIKDMQANQFSALIQREIDSVKSTAERIEKEHGIAKEIFHKAEYIKDYKHGIDPNDFKTKAKEIGFSQVKVEYYWYPGQGNVIREQSKETADMFDQLLKNLLPNSRYIYKYLRFILSK